MKNICGYWEIKKVETPYDKEVEYAMSTLVDYIELKDTTGYRLKLAPVIDGSFKKSKSRENIIVKVEDDSLRLYYSTPYDKWKETVLLADGEILKVKNEKGIIYTYKPFEKIDITQ
tara:strand:- start:746 stop:1093 length:348 start_codon:yes stop_codon:yes gene_type:complete